MATAADMFRYVYLCGKDDSGYLQQHLDGLSDGCQTPSPGSQRSITPCSEEGLPRYASLLPPLQSVYRYEAVTLH